MQGNYHICRGYIWDNCDIITDRARHTYAKFPRYFLILWRTREIQGI